MENSEKLLLSLKACKTRAILSEAEAIQIFLIKLENDANKWNVPRRSATEVARHFGVSDKAVRDIWMGRTWFHELIHLDPERATMPGRLKRPGRPKRPMVSSPVIAPFTLSPPMKYNSATPKHWSTEHFHGQKHSPSALATFADTIVQWPLSSTPAANKACKCLDGQALPQARSALPTPFDPVEPCPAFRGDPCCQFVLDDTSSPAAVAAAMAAEAMEAAALLSDGNSTQHTWLDTSDEHLAVGSAADCPFLDLVL